MTHLHKDMTMRSSLTLGAVRFLVLSACLIAATAVSALAAAQVTLENSVQKVETFVNEAGEPQRRLVDADSVVPRQHGRRLVFIQDQEEWSRGKDCDRADR